MSKRVSGENYPQLFKNTYGPELLSYFNEDGFGVFHPGVLTRYEPVNGKDGIWRKIRSTIATHNGNQGFEATYLTP